MRIAPLADVKARLSAYVEQCETDGPVVITRNGRAVADFSHRLTTMTWRACCWPGRRAFKACWPDGRASRAAKAYHERISGKQLPSACRTKIQRPS